MLHAILHEIQTSPVPLTVSELSRRLNIQSSALQGMLQFWVQKGRLTMDDAPGGGVEIRVCEGRTCFRSCPGPTHCPLQSRSFNAYSLKWS
jgi:hypothetical protein